MRPHDTHQPNQPAAVTSAFEALWFRRPGASPELQEWFDREARPALIVLTNRYLRPDQASTLEEVAGRAAEMCVYAIDDAVAYARGVMLIPWGSWARVIDASRVRVAVATLAEGFGIPSNVPKDLRWVMWRQWLPGFPAEMWEMLARESGPNE